MFERVFITVGTTSFQQLINLILSEDAVDLFLKWGVKQVRIQAGKGCVKKEDMWKQKGIEFKMYDYKSSVVEDMQWADLIISHAGAGTTVEALDLGKVLLVVPNETLMDNHQLELANKLSQEKYAFMATIETFFDQAAKIDPKSVRPFPRAQPELVAECIYKDILKMEFKSK